MSAQTEAWLDAVHWDEGGLVPVVTQDAASGRVLTLAWMNRAALAETVRSGQAVYWSRSRARLWRKGEESGHVQRRAQDGRSRRGPVRQCHSVAGRCPLG